MARRLALAEGRDAATVHVVPRACLPPSVRPPRGEVTAGPVPPRLARPTRRSVRPPRGRSRRTGAAPGTPGRSAWPSPQPEVLPLLLLGWEEQLMVAELTGGLGSPRPEIGRRRGRAERLGHDPSDRRGVPRGQPHRNGPAER